MSTTGTRGIGVRGALWIGAAVAATVAVMAVFMRPAPPPAPPNSSPIATTAPVAATRPAATRPATAPAGPLDYLALARRIDSRLADQEPLDAPVDLGDAAKLIVDAPVTFCGRRDLWTSHPDAPPWADVLKRSADDEAHVTPKPVRLVRWVPDPHKMNRWTATVVTDAGSAGRYELRSAGGSVDIGTPGRAYQWDRGLVWGDDDRIVVPTDRGVSVFSFDAQGRPAEQYQPLRADDAIDDGGEPPQIQLDGPGILAWVPASESGRARGSAVARFVDGRWETLAPQQWPTSIVHLVPLRDLSVLQLQAAAGGRVKLAVAQLAGGSADEAKVRQLVGQLSDEDDAKREAAYKELTLYGPSAWPVLEGLMTDQSPEAQLRIETLLRDRLTPTLGGMTPIDDRLRVVARLADRGAVLYAASGVRLAAPAGKPQPLVAPAWLAVRPGEAISLLPQPMVQDLRPDRARVSAAGGDWVVADAAHGPRRFIGRSFVPILPAALRSFDTLTGMDRRGRWVLAQSSDPAGKRLVLDPTLPDPTPRLPAWDMLVTKGKVGWTADDWPVIVTDAKPWKLKDRGWEPVDEKKEAVHTTPPAPPATATADGPPLCADADGTTYHGGRTDLVAVAKSGQRTVWPLPPVAQASREPYLVAGKGRLFLFNAPGRVVRIKPTPGEEQPFTVDGTFTRNVPDSGSFVRVWVDPAGRICAISAADRMHVMFPDGRIPKGIAQMMPTEAVDANRE